MQSELSRHIDWAALGRLRLSARRIAEGAWVGLHPSHRRGAGLEFAGHRSYVPGDDLRWLYSDAEEYARSICTMGHPMVWNEIRRQHARYPQLHRLFAQAPEALAWEPRPQGLGESSDSQ